MKVLALLAASGLALAACSSQPEAPTRQAISEITVNTDLTALGNRNAVNYWTNLDTDLKTALANEFVADIAPGGAVLSVDIDELSLANAYTQGFSENSTLSGRVNLTDPRGPEIGAYTVSATMAQAAATMEPGATVTANSTEFYQALVRAFARGAVEVINATPAS